MPRKLRVLHIASYFSGSKVYRELFSRLDAAGVEQIVYVAVRDPRLVGKNDIQEWVTSGSEVVYRDILNVYSRINYFHKIEKIYRDICTRLDISSFDLIHAHTWYSDGGVAARLSREFGVPFLVTVRNTDINLFYKKLFYLRNRGALIALESSSVLFVSEAHRLRFLDLGILDGDKAGIQKVSTVPNGISDFWLSNIGGHKRSDLSQLKLLYVGSFDSGKNVPRLIEAVDKVRRAGLDVSLSLVGSGGRDAKIVQRKARSRSYVNLFGRVDDQKTLLAVYRGHDCFCMPSLAETFGLVYIEALSQGLPIIYSENEGVDGMVPDNVGVAVDPKDTDSIAAGIREIFYCYSDYVVDPISVASRFNWETISDDVMVLYAKLLGA